MTDKKLSLLEKLIEVRKEVDYLEKDAKGNYPYVSGTKLLAKLRPKMDTLGVGLEPAVVGDPSWEVVQMNSKPHFLVSLKMTMTWTNADNDKDFIKKDWYAIGAQSDPSKAYGTALTYAFRYFLLNYFSIPNDKMDPDSFLDQHGPQIQWSTKGHRKALIGAMGMSNWEIKEVQDQMQAEYGTKLSDQLLKDQIEDLTRYIQGNPKPKDNGHNQDQVHEQKDNQENEEQQGQQEEATDKSDRYPWMDKNAPGLSTLVWTIYKSGDLRIMRDEDPDQYLALTTKWDRICKEPWPPNVNTDNQEENSEKEEQSFLTWNLKNEAMTARLKQYGYTDIVYIEEKIRDAAGAAGKTDQLQVDTWILNVEKVMNSREQFEAFLDKCQMNADDQKYPF